MRYQTFTDVFAENDATRERLKNTIGALDDQTVLLGLDGTGWSIKQIVEHISLVDEGICKICAKLLSNARENGNSGNGAVTLSTEFLNHLNRIENTKLEAPARVQPGGETSVIESLTRLSENRNKFGEIQPLFEILNTTDSKFPHPYFGELSATEWLVLRSVHEARHLNQIERILSKISA